MRQIVCITKNGTNPAYEGARIGVRRVMEAAGAGITSVFPETPDDPAQQSVLLAEALKARPDAIMISVADPVALDPLLAEAGQAGIPVVSFVSRSSAVAPACFVTSDNRALAEAIAKRLFLRMGGQGGVVVIEGNPASETSQPRTEGFLSAIAGAPGIELLARETGFYQRDPARNAMAAALARGTRPDGVLVANDFMALGVIEALEEAGLKIPVVSVNAMPQAISALRTGELLATAAFDAMKIACTAAMATLRLLDGEPVPSYIELPVDIVDGANCGPWEKGYEDRSLPEWGEVVAGA